MHHDTQPKRRDRRDFLQTSSAVCGALLAAANSPLSAAEPESPADAAVRMLYESLNDAQRKAMCFAWDKKGSYGGLPLRLHVTNNWAVSPMAVGSLNPEQQALVQGVFESVLEPGWTEKLHQQAKDDTGRLWLQDRRIAIFGTPGNGLCQCVISGFHLTFRAGQGPSGVAFGGALSHGHQPSGFHEKPGHPGNIFWYQAQEAHKVYSLLDGKQQQQALIATGMPYYEFNGRIDRTPILPTSQLERALEPDVRFRGEKAAELPGLPVAEMSGDQRRAMRQVLTRLLEPYRPAYRTDVLTCLEKQGGLEKCRLLFYREHQLGKEGEWDNWRIEGPAFIWYFRGLPHVHIWIHIAEDPSTPVTSHFG